MPTFKRENGYVCLDNNTKELECKLRTSDFMEYVSEMIVPLQIRHVDCFYYHMDTGSFLNNYFILKSSNINKINIHVLKCSIVNDIPNEDYGISVHLI